MYNINIKNSNPHNGESIKDLSFFNYMSSYEDAVRATEKRFKKTKGIPWTGSLGAVTHINGKAKSKALSKARKEKMSHILQEQRLIRRK